MLSKLLFSYTAGRPCRLIYRAKGSPYLERYFLFQFAGVTAYLHRFVEADEDEETHNHPFSALAICLSGWYDEERLIDADYFCSSGVAPGTVKPIYKVRRVRAGSLNLIRGGGLLSGDFHRIRSARRNTWTLFLHRSKRVSSWGFLKTDSGEWRLEHYLKNLVDRDLQPESDGDWWHRLPDGRDAGREPLDSMPGAL